MAISEEIEIREKPVSKAGKRFQAHETGIILGQRFKEICRCALALARRRKSARNEGGKLPGSIKQARVECCICAASWFKIVQ